ncbi:MAG: hypothetical protein H6Q57_1795 [Geobacteraceae bacterium]|nr:hypothetical protein [Geobacteraceae bacterium]
MLVNNSNISAEAFWKKRIRDVNSLSFTAAKPHCVDNRQNRMIRFYLMTFIPVTLWQISFA